MSEFDIILIKENVFEVDKLVYKKNKNYEDLKNLDMLKIKANYLDYEKSEKLLDNICEVHTVTKENLMEKVHGLIELDESHLGDVKDCYECEDYIYQVIYMMNHHEDTNLNEKENLLGSMLTLDKRLFFGKAILFRIKHSSLNDEENNYISTNKSNVLELIMNNYYHTGITIDVDNKFNQVYFNNEMKLVNPENNWSEVNNEFNFMTNKEYGFQYKEILGFSLNFIFKSTEEGKANEPISRLLEGVVKGNGIIISPYNENNYYDITVKDVINMLKLYQELNYKELDYEKIGVDKKSKYQIISSRLLNVK